MRDSVYAMIMLCTMGLTCCRTTEPVPMPARATMTSKSLDRSPTKGWRALDPEGLVTSRDPITLEEVERGTLWIDSFWESVRGDQVEMHPAQLKPVHFIDRAAIFVKEDAGAICFDVEVHDDSLHDMALVQMTPVCLEDGYAREATVIEDHAEQVTLWYRVLDIQASPTGYVQGDLKRTAAALHASSRIGVICCPGKPETRVALRLFNELYGTDDDLWQLTFTWELAPSPIP